MTKPPDAHRKTVGLIQIALMMAALGCDKGVGGLPDAGGDISNNAGGGHGGVANGGGPGSASGLGGGQALGGVGGANAAGTGESNGGGGASGIAGKGGATAGAGISGKTGGTTGSAGIGGATIGTAGKGGATSSTGGVGGTATGNGGMGGSTAGGAGKGGAGTGGAGGCIDTMSDPSNCGGCGIICLSNEACIAGACGAPGPVCAATGGQACGVSHTLFTCAAGNACDHPVCTAGFANCNRTSPDCETAFGTAGGCFPHYLGAFKTSPQMSYFKSALGADGSYYLAGTFLQATDFDPGPGIDVRSPQGPSDVFLTKFNSDWTYAWTVTFGGANSTSNLFRVSVSDTAIVLTGHYQDAIDLDPGPGMLIKTSFSGGGDSTFIASLSLDGNLSWGSALETGNTCFAEGLALAPNGDLYLAGYYNGTCDLDPGPALDVWPLASDYLHGFLVKLRGTDGARLWARSLRQPTPPIVPRAVTVALDGNVWLTGQYDGTQATTATIASYTPTGSVRFAGGLDPALGSSYSIAIAAAPDGSVYVGGAGSRAVDFDPGPGTASRVLVADFDPLGAYIAGSTFILKLGSDGTFGWVQTFARVELQAMAAHPMGGVVLMGGISVPGQGLFAGTLLARLESDSTPAWSLRFGGYDLGAWDLTAGASTFLVAGMAEKASDLDPGPAVDPIPAGASFLMRFAD